jgi:tRNA nucleotidyltransferase (CCA-adding enzyme)
MNSLRENGEKIFERLHTIEPKKMFRKYDDEFATIVLSQDTVTDSAVRRLVFDAGEDVENLMTCVKLILPPSSKFKIHNNFEIVRKKIEVEDDQVRNFQPPITGEEIMEIFNLKPSKEIGMLKEAIKKPY